MRYLVSPVAAFEVNRNNDARKALNLYDLEGVKLQKEMKRNIDKIAELDTDVCTLMFWDAFDELQLRTFVGDVLFLVMSETIGNVKDVKGAAVALGFSCHRIRQLLKIMKERLVAGLREYKKLDKISVDETATQQIVFEPEMTLG